MREAGELFILSLGENYMVFKCTFLGSCGKNKEPVTAPPGHDVPASLRARAGGAGAAPACPWRMDGSPSCLITRVEESNSKLLESEKKLQEERQRTVVLEQHLEKMRLEPGRTSVCQRAAPRSKAGRGWPRAPSRRGWPCR